MGARRRRHVPGPHDHRARPVDHPGPCGPRVRPTRQPVAPSSSSPCRGSRQASCRRRRSKRSGRASSPCPSLPARPELYWRDVVAALKIFVIVVVATFPVVLPFLLIQDVDAAKNVSRGDLARDAVPRRARARPVCGLRQLEGRPDDGRARDGADRRDQRARRMKAARSILGALALATATCASGADEASGRRASPADKPSWEFALTAYPDGRSRRRELHLGDRASPTAGRCTSRRATTTSRSARARPSSAGPSPAARRSRGS